MAKRYRFNFKQLDVYQAAVNHFAWTVAVFDRMPRASYVIRDQVQKAALSIMANIGEANGRDLKPGETEQHYRYAQGSTYESAAFLDALSALGAITDEEYNEREEHLARIASMLHRLVEKQTRRRSRS